MIKFKNWLYYGVSVGNSFFYFLGLMGAFAISVGLYFPVIDTFFLADDLNLLFGVATNSWHELILSPPAEFVHFRPFRFIPWIIGYSFFELNPSGYHIFNILVHALNGLLIFVCGYQLFLNSSKSDQAPYLAGLAVLLFLVLPYQTEVVAWNTGIVTAFATFFTLLAWWSFLKYQGGTTSKIGLLSTFYLIGSLGCFVIALLFKEIALFFPLLVLWHSVVFRDGWKKGFRHFLIYALPLIPYAIWRYATLGEWIGGYGTQIHLNYDPSLVGYHYLLYFLKFFAFYRFLPESLQAGLVALKSYATVSSIIGVGLLLLTTFLVVWYNWFGNFKRVCRSNKYFLFLIGALVLALLPVINLDTSFIHSPYSDRHGYLPSVFYCLSVALLLRKLLYKNIFFYGMGILIVLACTIGTWNTNKNWVKAGQIAETVLQEFKQKSVEHQKNYVVNMPARFKGVPVYARGFPEAVKLFDNPDKQVKIIALQMQATKKVKFDSWREQNLLTLQSQGARKAFRWVQPGGQDDPYSIIKQNSSQLQINIQPEKAVFLAYNEEHLINVREL
jgi:hypothetical protein